jgi:hypothetical protein
MSGRRVPSRSFAISIGAALAVSMIMSVPVLAARPGHTNVSACTPNGTDVVETFTWSGIRATGWFWSAGDGTGNGFGGFEPFGSAQSSGTLSHTFVGVNGDPTLVTVIGADLVVGTPPHSHNLAGASVTSAGGGFWPSC